MRSLLESPFDFFSFSIRLSGFESRRALAFLPLLLICPHREPQTMIFTCALLLAVLAATASGSGNISNNDNNKNDRFEMANVFDPESGHSHAPHKCIHDKIAKLITEEVEPQPYSIYAEAERKRQTTVPTAPLRVHFDTFNLGAQ
jgi:hypothetical protein